MLGKTMNAGQICLAPDYLMVSEDQLDEVISHARAIVAEMYPTMLRNPEYTSVINLDHYKRLTAYTEEAREMGVDTVSINPAEEDFSSQTLSLKFLLP